MAKNTPLQIPADMQALPAVLSKWSDTLNHRLRMSESTLENLQQQIENLIKANNLVRTP